MSDIQHPDRQPARFGHVLESNEQRLDRLDRRGVPVAVDGAAVLEFLFERALTTRTARELRRAWILNVAGLLNDVEGEVVTPPTVRPRHVNAEIARAS